MPYFSPYRELIRYPSEIRVIIKEYIVNDFAFIFKKNKESRQTKGYVLPVKSLYYMGLKRIMYNFYVSNFRGDVIDKCYYTNYVEVDYDDYVVVLIKYYKEFSVGKTMLLWQNYNTYLHRNLMGVIGLSGMSIKFANSNQCINYQHMDNLKYIDANVLIPSKKRKVR